MPEAEEKRMAALARDVMQSPVASVSPETPLSDIQRLFVEEEIHGAPVIGDSGAVVGVVTTTDLVNAVLEQSESGGFRTDYLRELIEFSGPDWQRGAPADFQDRLSQLTAADVMTPGAACVSDTAPVSQVAALMHERHIHRVWVTQSGVLAGVISSFDLLPLVADSGT
jgi:CBS domain-containing protein